VNAATQGGTPYVADLAAQLRQASAACESGAFSALYLARAEIVLGDPWAELIAAGARRRGRRPADQSRPRRLAGRGQPRRRRPPTPPPPDAHLRYASDSDSERDLGIDDLFGDEIYDDPADTVA